MRRALASHYTTLRIYAEVGQDLTAQHRFELATADLLTMDELIAVETADWSDEPVRISPKRAVEIALALAEGPAALDLLPSLAQHHTLNTKVIGEAKDCTAALIEHIDQLLAEGE